LFQPFKPFNRFAEPALSKAEGFKPSNCSKRSRGSKRSKRSIRNAVPVLSKVEGFKSLKRPEPLERLEPAQLIKDSLTASLARC
jgi:hypothetical protein